MLRRCSTTYNYPPLVQIPNPPDPLLHQAASLPWHCSVSFQKIRQSTRCHASHQEPVHSRFGNVVDLKSGLTSRSKLAECSWRNLLNLSDHSAACSKVTGGGGSWLSGSKRSTAVSVVRDLAVAG